MVKIIDYNTKIKIIILNILSQYILKINKELIEQIELITHNTKKYSLFQLLSIHSFIHFR
jgi:hypothetical protein